MTLLSVIKDVCAVVGVTQPASVFSGITGNRTMQEMLALANEMAQRIAYDNRDWTELRQTHFMTGDGAWVPPYPILPDTEPPDTVHTFTGTTAFPIPANFKRMLLTSNVWRTSSTQQPMTFVPDTDEWVQNRLANHSSAFGEWTKLGGEMHVFPIMPVGVSAYYAYLDKNCIRLASGGFGDRFLDDADSFRLDERVLTLGMIWQWKSQKGASYAEDMGTYGDALSYAMGHDSPAPIIIGRKVSSWGKVSAPWPS
jgi:hypothetical protein